MRHQTTSPHLKSCATTAASCCSAGAAPMSWNTERLVLSGGISRCIGNCLRQRASLPLSPRAWDAHRSPSQPFSLKIR